MFRAINRTKQINTASNLKLSAPPTYNSILYALCFFFLTPACHAVAQQSVGGTPDHCFLRLGILFQNFQHGFVKIGIINGPS